MFIHTWHVIDSVYLMHHMHHIPHISIHVTMLRGRRIAKLYNKALLYNFQSTSLLRGMKLVIRGQVITCIYLYNKGMLFFNEFGKFNALVHDENF